MVLLIHESNLQLNFSIQERLSSNLSCLQTRLRVDLMILISAKAPSELPTSVPPTAATLFDKIFCGVDLILVAMCSRDSSQYPARSTGSHHGRRNRSQQTLEKHQSSTLFRGRKPSSEEVSYSVAISLPAS